MSGVLLTTFPAEDIARLCFNQAYGRYHSANINMPLVYGVGENMSLNRTFLPRPCLERELCGAYRGIYGEKEMKQLLSMFNGTLPRSVHDEIPPGIPSSPLSNGPIDEKFYPFTTPAPVLLKNGNALRDEANQNEIDTFTEFTEFWHDGTDPETHCWCRYKISLKTIVTVFSLSAGNGAILMGAIMGGVGALGPAANIDFNNAEEIFDDRSDSLASDAMNVVAN